MFSVRARVLAVAGLAISGGSSMAIAQCPGLTFASSADYAAGTINTSVAVGDLDGDGDADLAISNGSSSLADLNLRILLNDGNGTFAPGESYTAGQSTQRVVLGDLDGDGDLDMVGASFLSVSNQITVRFNNGNATFGPRIQYDTGDDGAFSVALGDLDGDGDLDMVVPQRNAVIAVLINSGNGVFTAGQSITSEQTLSTVALGDLDGDGDLDLVTPNATGDNIGVRLSNGDGTFAPAAFVAAGDGVRAVTLGDFDGDSDLDMAAINPTANTISVLANRGNATFAPAVNYAVGTSSYFVSASDLDSDGDLELAVGYSGSTDFVSVLQNSGNGVFAPRIDYPAGAGTWSVAFGDLDSDGDIDMATARPSSAGVLRNTGVFAPAIATQPANAAVCSGEDATFTVAMVATGVYTYQWRRGGEPIPGAVDATLTVSGATSDSMGIYDVVVSNGCSSITSTGAALIVGGPGCGTACPADFNLDGGIDGSDVSAFFTAWESGC